MLNSPVRTLSSDYMHWAKTLQASRFNLANSGLAAAPRSLLPFTLDDIELSGPSYYGWAPLQAALARHLRVPESSVVHATGTSGANHLVMSLLLEPGDDVVIEQPTYELLTATAGHTGARILRLPRRVENRFLPDPGELRRLLTPRTRLVVLTNLHNPTSARLSPDLIRELASACAQVGASLLIDEVYLDAAAMDGPIIGIGDAQSSFSLADNILVTSSLTKVYGLSGLRAGWILAQPEVAQRLWRLNDLFGVIPAHPAERLTVKVFENFTLFRNRARTVLEGNRALLNGFLAGRRDLECGPLEGGTVVFPKLRGGRVEELCRIFRERYEGTVVPGRFFDMADHIRIGIGREREETMEGLRRLGMALDDLARESGG